MHALSPGERKTFNSIAFLESKIAQYEDKTLALLYFRLFVGCLDSSCYRERDANFGIKSVTTLI